MKVILLEDVKKVGKKDAIVEVSDGYANNYLLKNKLAVSYTKKSKEVLDKELEERKIKEDTQVKEYNKIKDSLKNTTLKFKVKTGNDDKVFGKISTKQIADKLKELNYNIDKKCISFDHDLDTLGIHEITITLHKQVNFKIKVHLEK